MTEKDVMPIICRAWNVRASELELPKKGKTRELDREAFMQGALQALLCTGVLDQHRCSQIAFMCAIGRLPEFMEAQAKS